MSQILHRLKEYIDNKGIAISAFEKSIGMSNASFSKQLKKEGAIGTDKLENILNIYPDISPEWLLTGNGDMLKTDRVSRHIPTENIPVAEYNDTKCPAINDISDYKTRPRIPFEAAAGSLSIALDSVSESQCERLPIIPTFPKYDFTIIARGASMEPDITSGDELACRFIRESSFIQWGRTHVLDTAQGIVVKRIFEHENDIICKSNNSNYPDFNIPKEDIYHVAMVVGLIRHF